MDLLIEASVPAAQGPPTAPPGSEQAPEGVFPALLQSLFAAVGGTVVPESAFPTTGQAPKVAEATAGEAETKMGEAGENAAGDVLALAAVLASLQAQPGVAGASAPIPPGAQVDAIAGNGGPFVDGVDGARQNTGGAAIPSGAVDSGSSTGITDTAGLPPPAASYEPGDEADPGSSGTRGATPAPPAEPGAAPPEMQSPGVVRSDGNAIQHDRPADVQSAPGAEVLQQLTASQPTPAPGADASPVAAEEAPRNSQLHAPAVQVVDAVVDRIADGGGEARLRLDPPELGEIVIHVSVDGDAVRVDVQTETADAARVLRESTPGLTALLSDRGLSMADVFVGQQSMGQGNRGANPEWAAREPQPASFGALLGIEPASDIRNHNRIRAAYNPDGAFDFRV